MTTSFLAQANNVWTMAMDREVLEWASEKPEDWWPSSDCKVYTWGQGSYGQLGRSDGDTTSPALVPDWTDLQRVHTYGAAVVSWKYLN